MFITKEDESGSTRCAKGCRIDIIYTAGSPNSYLPKVGFYQKEGTRGKDTSDNPLIKPIQTP